MNDVFPSALLPTFRSVEDTALPYSTTYKLECRPFSAVFVFPFLIEYREIVASCDFVCWGHGSSRDHVHSLSPHNAFI